jgi:hypothetical protein
LLSKVAIIDERIPIKLSSFSFPKRSLASDFSRSLDLSSDIAFLASLYSII